MRLQEIFSRPVFGNRVEKMENAFSLDRRACFLLYLDLKMRKTYGLLERVNGELYSW